MKILTRKSTFFDSASMCKPPPWIIHAGEMFYDCWQCVYEPLFWLMYLFSCMWESHLQQKQRYIDDMMTFSAEDDDELHILPEVATTVTDAPTTNKRNMIRNVCQGQTNKDNVRTFRYSKSYIKRTLKSHFKCIRQKQRLLNSMMKQSLLRRARKVVLIQPPPPLAESSTTNVAPLFISTKLMEKSGLFYSSSPLSCSSSKKLRYPLPPLKTLAHQGKLTPEIVSLSKSLVFF